VTWSAQALYFELTKQGATAGALQDTSFLTLSLHMAAHLLQRHASQAKIAYFPFPQHVCLPSIGGAKERT